MEAAISNKEIKVEVSSEISAAKVSQE